MHRGSKHTVIVFSLRQFSKKVTSCEEDRDMSDVTVVTALQANGGAQLASKRRRNYLLQVIYCPGGKRKGRTRVVIQLWRDTNLYTGVRVC